VNTKPVNAAEETQSIGKPHIHMQLWQSYVHYQELTHLRRGIEQRIMAIEQGRSAGDVTIEQDYLAMFPPEYVKLLREQLCSYYVAAGPIADWLARIPGLGSNYLAAQLIAQIDDIGKFPTIAKLWRFCGCAVIDGQAEYGTRHYSRTVKSLLLGPQQIGRQFLLHHTMPYRDIYDSYKEQKRQEHPTPRCRVCDVDCVKDTAWRCPNCGATNNGARLLYTPAHLDKMALRYAVKAFLRDLWLTWRQIDGLPVGQPYQNQPIEAT